MTQLERMGWRPELAAALAALPDPGLAAQRVVSADRRGVRTSDGAAEVAAVVPGKLRHRARSRDLPVVGDWVAVRREGGAVVIVAVLPRRSELARRDPDQRSEQVLAANVDLAVLVMGLDGDFNLRRLERYVALVRSAAVTPVVVLSKADLTSEAAARTSEVEAAFPGVPVLALALLAPGAERAIEPLLPPGATAVLLGSSGAGKSTLLNALVGHPVARTGSVREHDSRGRHTTTTRQLFTLPGGALAIDTPGIRELELLDAASGMADAFPELLDLGAHCRFRDCRHIDEPGCAVRKAVEEGRASGERVDAFRKLAAELARNARAPRRRR
jgi:ribosome biogenesis GTPase / thiamine phosphate phosphatase